MDLSKGYTNRSNANRFATKTAKLPKGSFHVEPREGKFYIVMVNGVKPETVLVREALHKALTEDTAKTDEAQLIADLTAERKFAAKEVKAQSKRKTARTKKAKTARKGGQLTGVPMLHQSEIKRPCKTVWAIAEGMPGAKRADVLRACVTKGIAFFTARTQYQQFRAAQLRSKKAK